MSRVLLSSSMVAKASCPQGKKKVDYFDTHTKGLLLEVRETGGKTFYVRYRDQRGRTRQLRLADARDVSLAQARQLADKTRNKVAMGTDPAEEKALARGGMTFGEFISAHYLPYVKGYKRSWNSDECYLRLHLTPLLGAKYLDEISKQDVIAFHHGMKAKGYALGTCNRCLILLRYALNLAVRWEIGGAKANPTHGVPLFEDLAGKKERYLSKEEAQRLYESVKRSENPMLQYIIPMLILTGARKREVLDARWEDFDMMRKQWRIPISKSGRPRHVPLSDGVIQLLASVPHDDRLPWIFPNPKTGKPYVSIFYSWDTARIDAGLSDVRIHDLRHSFASFLVNAGRSLYEVQKILGHTQVKTTQRYAHLAQETLVEAANAAVASLGDVFQVASPPAALPPATAALTA